MIFYLIGVNHGNMCIAEVTVKPVKLGDRKEMPTLNFSGQEIHINILKGQLQLYNTFLLEK